MPPDIDFTKDGWLDEYVDTTDLDYLTDLFYKQNTAENDTMRGYYIGRAEEYAAQNAVDDSTIQQAKVNAKLRAFGDGPKTGAQC